MLKKPLFLVYSLLIVFVLLFAQGDILDESFEGAGYENGENGVGSWLETVGTNCVVDEDDASVARPTGGEDQILEIVKAAGDTFDARTRWNKGAEVPITYTTFYVQVNAEGLANAQELTLAGCIDSSPALCWDVRLRQETGGRAGDVTFELNVWIDAGPPDFTDTYPAAAGSITFDQWYRIDVKYANGAPGTWEWRVDETPEGNDALTSGREPQYWDAGGVEDFTLTAYIDLYNVETTGYVTIGDGDGAPTDAVFFGANFLVLALLLTFTRRRRVK